jgi:hypothetical protein
VIRRGPAGCITLSYGERGRACESVGRRKVRIRGASAKKKSLQPGIGRCWVEREGGWRKAARRGRDEVLIPSSGSNWPRQYGFCGSSGVICSYVECTILCDTFPILLNYKGNKQLKKMYYWIAYSC